ncbi:hypothetical protein [Pseudomonas chlororaphis]|uniref:hypothetical protein n=1 Tax=Pseudomonas chlororaphis TaxID=587753 RepID=UPI001B336597|nr:hypothetical protein [Pseudomonas chlororaphis]MBP5055327.1 hypothetical protein [Pseudomonas chlororaphis]MBP5142436.1 hypothetical protein [Pseudomonas chlororaphis]
MTTNQTIDGVLVSREWLENIYLNGLDGLNVTTRTTPREELRALLDAPACKTCNGTRLVSDGAMHCSAGGIPFENGPIDCVKDCPDCTQAAQPQGEPVAAQKYDDTLLPFLALMRKELHANVGKGDRPGWLTMSSDNCLLEIFYHLGKLQKSVKNRDAAGMTEYAADVANMCMMLLDICGVLAFIEPPAPVAVVDDDWRMNPCKQGHADVGAAGGVASCHQCGEKITARTTEEAFALWNSSHPKACCGSCPAGCTVGAKP